MLFQEVQARHKLLTRQIKKMLGETELNNPKIQAFLEIISETYKEFEEERELVERSMEISSQELTGSLDALRKQQNELSEAYSSLRSTQTQLAETERIAQMRKEMQEAIEQKNDALLASKQELKQNLEELQMTQERLEEQKNYLEKTLHELQNAQQQLINTEKMAALGQLVANIAHEINTPLGAISSSIKFIHTTFQNVLPQTSHFLPTLTPEEFKLFFSFIVVGTQNTQTLSTREERQIRRTLHEKLLVCLPNKNDLETIADTLVDMGVYQNIEPFLPLIQNEKALDLAYRLSALQRSVNTIQTATQKAAKIIFALKNFSHRDSNNQMTVVDLQDTIDVVLTIYQNHLKRGVEVVWHLKDIPLFLGYPDELMQVWTNLLHNALQAMDNAGTITIMANFDQANNMVKVSFTDTGKGIPKSIQDKVFNAFFTTKKIGEGSGLGLDIVRKIVDKHGGKIYFESEEGVGTTFFVELPYQEASNN